MSIERLHKGPRMSQCVIHNKTVYLAGQVAAGARRKKCCRANRGYSGDHRYAVGGSENRQEQGAVGDNLAHGHVELFGNEQGLGPLGGSRRNSGAGDGLSAQLAAPEFKIEIAVIAAQP